MEEKERYELIGYCSYRDTETGVIGDNFVELLNQQDAKIKELEYMVIDKQNKLYSRLDKIKELQEENQQLKQQLHDLPKNIVEDIQENFDWRQCCEIRKYYDQQYIWFNYIVFNDFLDAILKKYGGNDNAS